MWLITPFGFFSVVRKTGDHHLTIRARVAEDLDALRRRYLAELSPTVEGAGTDYAYRATCTHEELARAQAALVQDIDYPNFKSEVAARQGHARAKVYGRVWSALHELEQAVDPWAAPTRRKAAYGGVLIDDGGRVLLRRPAGDFDGTKWTFAKGKQDVGETPARTALREVLEETGYAAEVLTRVPQTFEGNTSSTRYFLMRASEQVQEPGWETQDLRWCTPDEARGLIRESPSAVKWRRDLAVLEAALVLL
jgi:8-oxo-dGTP pyrophosphatase MutT (NUDIX family)